MEKNKENKNNQKNDEQKLDNIDNDAKVNKDHLILENENLKEQVNVLTKQLDEALKEIKRINADYVEKITAKSNEAKKIIQQKEQELQEKYAKELDDRIARYIEKKISGMLDSINQLSNVLKIEPQSPEAKNYLMGFKMILNSFENSLIEMNITKFDVNVGDKFDETIMSAFEVVETNKYSSNCVVEVISPAYKFDQKLIKHAIVKVQK